MCALTTTRVCVQHRRRCDNMSRHRGTFSDDIVYYFIHNISNDCMISKHEEGIFSYAQELGIEVLSMLMCLSDYWIKRCADCVATSINDTCIRPW